jgi:hypothetical protein
MIIAHKKNWLHDNILAYQAWQISLIKNGFPKNKNGTMMNVEQLYNYWLSDVDKKSWIAYAVRMRQKPLKRKPITNGMPWRTVL